MRRNLIKAGMALVALGGAVALMMGQPDVIPQVQAPPALSSFTAAPNQGKIVLFASGQDGEITVHEFSTPEHPQIRLGPEIMRMVKEAEILNRVVKRYPMSKKKARTK